MPGHSSSRRPPQRFVPAPAPGVSAGPPTVGPGHRDAASDHRHLPPLPISVPGAPPGRPPGTTRPTPPRGGASGMPLPPELRRRLPRAGQAAPGAADAAALIRLALRTALRKLLASRRKLHASVAARRAQFGPRG